MYDLQFDAALIAQSIAKQYGILPSEQAELAFSDWSLLVAGLMEDTPLGRVVAIRCEHDPAVLSEWAAFQATRRREDSTDEKAIRTQMAQLQQALKSAFGRKGA